MNDLRRVLFYPHIRKRHRWNDATIDAFVESFLVAATLTPGTLDIRAVIDDPADDKILACAVEGRVDYIVASDKHLTELRIFGGMPIVPPRQFLHVLESEAQ